MNGTFLYSSVSNHWDSSKRFTFHSLFSTVMYNKYLISHHNNSNIQFDQQCCEFAIWQGKTTYACNSVNHKYTNRILVVMSHGACYFLWQTEKSGRQTIHLLWAGLGTTLSQPIKITFLVTVWPQTVAGVEEVLADTTLCKARVFISCHVQHQCSLNEWLCCNYQIHFVVICIAVI